MATLYNKTALKKVKKDELIQMFLDQQAKMNDIKMDIDGDGLLKQGYKTELSNSHKQQNRMVKEITKLKEQLKEPKELFLYKAKVKELKEENEKLKGKLLSKSEELSNIRREKLELEDILFEHIKKGTI